MKRLMFFVAMLLLSIPALSDDKQQLTRDEVSLIKKKLVAVVDAVGQPSAGYVKENENFSLPTDAYRIGVSGKFRPLYAGAERRFGGGAEKKGRQTEKTMQKDYQKKMSDAMARGDYQEVQRLQQQMIAEAYKAEAEKEEMRKEPIEIRVSLNANQYQSIDPDMVLFEKPGVIALKFPNQGDEEKTRVVLYVDPVSLKDTKQLSVVEFKEPQDGVGKKIAVLTITIELSGPTDTVEALAKKVNTGAVLAQIDAR